MAVRRDWHLSLSTFPIDRPLKELEAGSDFVRVHRSAMVNLDHAEEMVRGYHGAWVVPISGPGSRAKLGLA